MTTHDSPDPSGARATLSIGHRSHEYFALDRSGEPRDDVAVEQAAGIDAPREILGAALVL